MLKKALILAGKDIRLMYRDRGAVFGSYIAPIFIIIIFGIIYSGMSSDDNEWSIDLLVIDEKKNERSEAFIAALTDEDVFEIMTTDDSSGEEIPLTRDSAWELILEGDAQLAVIYEATEANPDFPVLERPVITLLYDPASDMERQVTAGLIQRAVFMGIGTDLPVESMDWVLDELGVSDTPTGQLLTEHMQEWMQYMEDEDAGESDDDTSAAGMDMMMENMIDLRTEEVVNPDVQMGNPFMANSSAGIIVMFLLFSVSYAAATLLKEKQEGTIKRLLMAPITVDSIIFGKFLSIGFNSLCQLTVMLVLASIVFKVHMLGNLPTIIIISLATVAAVTAFGMIIAALAKSYDQINAAVTVIVLTMSAVGGSMFPRILMPEWMKTLGFFTINGWAIDGYLDAIYRFKGPGSVLGYGEASNLCEVVRNSEALVLVLFAVICGWIAARIFRRRLAS